MDETEDQISPGDTVLCTARGMESWPARVVDERVEQVTEEVKRSKPRGNKHKLVKYFQEDSYSWLLPKDLKKLSDSDLAAGEAKQGISKRLKLAYKMAQDRDEWLIRDMEANIHTLQDRLKRAYALKSGTYEESQPEEEEEDEDAEQSYEEDQDHEATASGHEQKQSSKRKRRRTSPASGQSHQPAARQRPEDQPVSLSLSGPSTESTSRVKPNNNNSSKPSSSHTRKHSTSRISPASHSPPSAVSQSPKAWNGKQHQRAPSSGMSHLSLMSPADGHQQCRKWRDELQRSFLQRPLSTLDPVKMNQTFKAIETFHHRPEWLLTSKLPKIVKRISMLSDPNPDTCVSPIPREADFHFQRRAVLLVDAWKRLFGFAAEASANGHHTPPLASSSSASAALQNHLQLHQQPSSSHHSPATPSGSVFDAVGGRAQSQGQEDAGWLSATTASATLDNRNMRGGSHTSAQSSHNSPAMQVDEDSVGGASSSWTQLPQAAAAVHAARAEPTTKISDFLNQASPGLGDEVGHVLVKHGICSLRDLQYFTKARWSRFAQQRLAQDLPSAREFVVSDAVEAYLDTLS